MNGDKILLSHGSGGKHTHDLVENLFIRYFKNPVLDEQGDSALFDTEANQKIAFTTDSFVVDPVFFPGGNIGKLAVAGTVNDLTVTAAIPRYISCGIIIEEGFPLSDLKTIVKSMAQEALQAGVQIVTGDTKVVDRGKCDKIFINTSGIGFLKKQHEHISKGNMIEPGDKILINGSLADHGMCIMSQRNELNFETDIKSDCASLNVMIHELLQAGIDIKFMRDATRGGLSTVLYELASNLGYGIEIEEKSIPVKENVRGICELLGFDPVYVANEGKVVIVVSNKDADKALDILRKNALGKDASIIGKICREHPGKGWITTSIGGKRMIDMLAGEQLPRIC